MAGPPAIIMVLEKGLEACIALNALGNHLIDARFRRLHQGYMTPSAPHSRRQHIIVIAEEEEVMIQSWRG